MSNYVERDSITIEALTNDIDSIVSTFKTHQIGMQECSDDLKEKLSQQSVAWLMEKLAGSFAKFWVKPAED